MNNTIQSKEKARLQGIQAFREATAALDALVHSAPQQKTPTIQNQEPDIQQKPDTQSVVDKESPASSIEEKNQTPFKEVSMDPPIEPEAMVKPPIEPEAMVKPPIEPEAMVENTELATEPLIEQETLVENTQSITQSISELAAIQKEEPTAIKPIPTTPTKKPTVNRWPSVPWVYVPVEKLGSGVVRLLGDAVGCVVVTCQKGGKILRKKPSKKRNQ